MFRPHVSDLIHAIGVAFVCIAATIYVLVIGRDDSNIWIVYGSAIAFYAGRAGASTIRQFTTTGDRHGDADE